MKHHTIHTGRKLRSFRYLFMQLSNIL